MRKKLEKEELKWLRSKLQYGDVRKIARATGCTSHTVSKFLGGSVYRAEILEAVMKLIDKRRNILDKFDQFRQFHSEEPEKT